MEPWTAAIVELEPVSANGHEMSAPAKAASSSASTPIAGVPPSWEGRMPARRSVALNAALSSCAPGVMAMNIDNGFGAAAAAIKILGIARR
jgi:NCAIR mutase (PurE)-related protein